MAHRDLYWCNNGCGKKVTATDKRIKTKYSSISVLFQCKICKEKYINTTPTKKTHLKIK